MGSEEHISKQVMVILSLRCRYFIAKVDRMNPLVFAGITLGAKQESPLVLSNTWWSERYFRVSTVVQFVIDVNFLWLNWWGLWRPPMKLLGIGDAPHEINLDWHH